jgi:hypothetical protein
LHFVGDTDAAVRANVFVRFAEIAGRENDLARYAGKSFRNVGGNPPPFRFQPGKNLNDVSGIFLA